VPTYAYRCAACGHAFDIHQSFSDSALTVCSECGGPLRKQYGSIGVTFKGSGFYRTDSRSGASSSSSSSSTPAKSTATKSASA
jgi:putative FmdB family regulatory protein